MSPSNPELGYGTASCNPGRHILDRPIGYSILKACSIDPLGTASSMPASPSKPSLRRESSIASSYQSTGQVRPSIEPFSEQTGPLVLAQQSHRILNLDNKDAQTANSCSPGLSIRQGVFRASWRSHGYIYNSNQSESCAMDIGLAGVCLLSLKITHSLIRTHQNGDYL